MSPEPKLRTHWLHASGGLVWHLRALRYHDTLWQGFRQIVRSWLRDWQPPTDKLLVVGPSAGYTLDLEFLQRWREIVVLEPDPLARWLLRRRFPSVEWRFENIDVFLSNKAAPLTKRFSEHAVLFSNVLGQISPRTEHLARPWLLSLRASLATHHWASYHDVISTEREPDTSPPQALAAGVSLDAVIKQFWRGGEIEVLDHCTFGLGKPGEYMHEYCVWPLRQRHYHLVEWLIEEPRHQTGGKTQATAAPGGKEV